jgi:hypothetical protein
VEREAGGCQPLLDAGTQGSPAGAVADRGVRTKKCPLAEAA